MKITKQQVKDCYENKELLKEYFPDVFKLESGKWYKKEKAICYKGENGGNYGINGLGEFIYRCDWFWEEGWEEATKEEVEKALISEADKRGFVEGIKYTSPNGSFTRIIKTPFYLSYDMDSLCCPNGDYVMNNGKWAEIIQETEIELTLDQIAEKFGVDKVKIKKD